MIVLRLPGYESIALTEALPCSIKLRVWQIVVCTECYLTKDLETEIKSESPTESETETETESESGSETESESETEFESVIKS